MPREKGQVRATLALGATLLGIGLTVVLVGHIGVGAIGNVLLAVGWTGFLAIVAIHVAIIAVMGSAWHILAPQGGPLRSFIWGRFVRDGGSEVLPLSQIGGYVLGARAAMLGGVPGIIATASTIVDVTIDLIAQLGYTTLGLACLIMLKPHAPVILPVAAGLVAAAVVAGMFIGSQRHGFDALDRLGRWIGAGWAEGTAARAAAIHQSIHRIYRARRRVVLSFFLHFGCWTVGAVEVWLALRLIGSPLSPGATLALESLLYAVRSLAFFVPNAVGVQEGAYVLLGASFGLTPDVALAVSLLKRARDLAIGVPVLCVWQGQEGLRLSRRSN